MSTRIATYCLAVWNIQQMFWNRKQWTWDPACFTERIFPPHIMMQGASMKAFFYFFLSKKRTKVWLSVGDMHQHVLLKWFGLCVGKSVDKRVGPGRVHNQFKHNIYCIQCQCHLQLIIGSIIFGFGFWSHLCAICQVYIHQWDSLTIYSSQNARNEECRCFSNCRRCMMIWATAFIIWNLIPHCLLCKAI